MVHTQGMQAKSFSNTCTKNPNLLPLYPARYTTPCSMNAFNVALVNPTSAKNSLLCARQLSSNSLTISLSSSASTVLSSSSHHLNTLPATTYSFIGRYFSVSLHSSKKGIQHQPSSESLLRISGSLQQSKPPHSEATGMSGAGTLSPIAG